MARVTFCSPAYAVIRFSTYTSSCILRCTCGQQIVATVAFRFFAKKTKIQLFGHIAPTPRARILLSTQHRFGFTWAAGEQWPDFVTLFWTLAASVKGFDFPFHVLRWSLHLMQYEQQSIKVLSWTQCLRRFAGDCYRSFTDFCQRETKRSALYSVYFLW